MRGREFYCGIENVYEKMPKKYISSSQYKVIVEMSSNES